ncbi:MAG: SMC-Scp complex subunit ScpB [Defluviitaleaceae bacterium]|nr:SMC-Scp complex subunit ScpB [Defluviitaleaceae bacterium]
MNMIEYEAVVEALLFAAGEPIEARDIAKSLEIDIGTARSLVDNLSCKYDAEKRGITIVELDGSFQMCTNPRYFEYVKKVFGNAKKKPLTPALLETLAIIAYKQPITKVQIEHIRGVGADHSVNKLVEYSLVAECGRADTPGKPVLFATTGEFLKYFGISSLQQLPALEEDHELLKTEALAELSE